MDRGEVTLRKMIYNLFTKTGKPQQKKDFQQKNSTNFFQIDV